MTCLRHCGLLQANYLMLKSLWKNTTSLIGFSDGFYLLQNCVLLQRWVCMCTGLHICGSWEWIWWGSIAQYPERIGFSMEGTLGSTYIHWWRALWHLELFAIWELKPIFHDPSVCSAYKVGYLLLFVCCYPWTFVLQVPFSILVWGSCKSSHLTIACHVLVAQMMQAYAKYLHKSAEMVFGITQQCNFCCASVLGDWGNLEIFRLTDYPWAARYLQ